MLPHAPCQQFYIAHLHQQKWVQVGAFHLKISPNPKTFYIAHLHQQTWVQFGAFNKSQHLSFEAATWYWHVVHVSGL